MSQIMQDAQVKARSENQPTVKPVQEARSKSSFDDAEYERWSENLRNRGNSKSK
jgi:hypothetical protein